MNPDTLKALERWADDEFRSVNGQIEYLLQKALKENGRLDKENDNLDKTQPNQEEKTSE